MTEKTAFETPEGEADYLAVYEAVMKLWPVPYERIEIPTRSGMTHVVTSGPKDAPPLVLLQWAMRYADHVGTQCRRFQQGLPVLLLIGEQEVMYDPAKALALARRLLPDFEGELVPQSSHEMCSSQYRIVDARVLDFLNHN